MVRLRSKDGPLAESGAVVVPTGSRGDRGGSNGPFRDCSTVEASKSRSPIIDLLGHRSDLLGIEQFGEQGPMYTSFIILSFCDWFFAFLVEKRPLENQRPLWKNTMGPQSSRSARSMNTADDSEDLSSVWHGGVSSLKMFSSKVYPRQCG